MLGGRVFEQALTFAVMAATGVVLGFTYDVFRVARRFLRLSRLILFFMDLFYWLLAAVVVFLVLLASNWGEVRAYVFLALGFGGSVYALTLTRLCYRLLICLTEKILKACRLIATPFTCAARMLGRKATFFEKNLNKPLQRGQEMLGKIRDRFHKKKE